VAGADATPAVRVLRRRATLSTIRAPARSAEGEGACGTRPRAKKTTQR
jgi:hypothetical protein